MLIMVVLSSYQYRANESGGGPVLNLMHKILIKLVGKHDSGRRISLVCGYLLLVTERRDKGKVEDLLNLSQKWRDSHLTSFL